MNFNSFSRAELKALVDGLGEPAARIFALKVMSEEGFCSPKFPKVTAGHGEAVLNKLVASGGEGIIEKLLSGEVEPEWKEAIRALFDSHDRRIPPKGMQASQTDADYNFTLQYPEKMEDSAIKDRVEYYFDQKVELTVKEIHGRTGKILNRLNKDIQTKNLVESGRYLLTVWPQMEVKDIGQWLENLLLAVGASYNEVFPDRQFINHRQGELKGQVQVVEASRCGRFFTELAKGPLVTLSFPQVLQGYSIDADRQQMAGLPEDFCLSGPDMIGQMIAHASILARDFHTPGLDLAAFFWESAGYSLYLRAHGDELGFDHTGNLGIAYDYFSGGLFILG